MLSRVTVILVVREMSATSLILSYWAKAVSTVQLPSCQSRVLQAGYRDPLCLIRASTLEEPRLGGPILNLPG